MRVGSRCMREPEECWREPSRRREVELIFPSWACFGLVWFEYLVCFGQGCVELFR